MKTTLDASDNIYEYLALDSSNDVITAKLKSPYRNFGIKIQDFIGIFFNEKNQYKMPKLPGLSNKNKKVAEFVEKIQLQKPLRVPQESRENVSDYRDRPLSLSEYEQGIKELEDEIQKSKEVKERLKKQIVEYREQLGLQAMESPSVKIQKLKQNLEKISKKSENMPNYAKIKNRIDDLLNYTQEQTIFLLGSNNNIENNYLGQLQQQLNEIKQQNNLLAEELCELKTYKYLRKEYYELCRHYNIQDKRKFVGGVNEFFGNKSKKSKHLDASAEQYHSSSGMSLQQSSPE